MENKERNKHNEAVRLLSKQKIRDVWYVSSYKVSICHSHSVGISMSIREIYIAINFEIAAEKAISVVHVFNTFSFGVLSCKELLVSCGVTDAAMESASVY
ncbi:MAG: hypothetical protein LBL90_01580 [Prevotellaceae bacterium]|jgi:hypothetical protein|nr:hypothetical protein [Prevotellaceae bacterium]